MGWTAAPPLVRGLAVAVFLAVSVAVALAVYRSDQMPLVAVMAIGVGGIIAVCVLGIGSFLSRYEVQDIVSQIFTRQTYTRKSVPQMLMLGILAAVFVVFALHLKDAIRHGSALSGWTAAVLAAVIFYPVLRHRIERGRWPD